MLKVALFFAVAGFALAGLAPVLMPMIERASRSEPASAKASLATDSTTAEPAKIASARPQQGYRELQIPANGQNQYFVEALVNGVNVRFLVDTGATFVSLSPAVAARIGLWENASSPHYRFNTANGVTTGYGVKLNTIDFGSIYMADVDAVVNPGLGPLNLLGENFLHKLASVEQRDGRLILRQ
jgi:aspartyl protease family protein